MASNGITFIQNFVKIGELVQMLKGREYTDNIVISQGYFFLKKGKLANKCKFAFRLID